MGPVLLSSKLAKFERRDEKDGGLLPRRLNGDRVRCGKSFSDSSSSLDACGSTSSTSSPVTATTSSNELGAELSRLPLLNLLPKDRRPLLFGVPFLSSIRDVSSSSLASSSFGVTLKFTGRRFCFFTSIKDLPSSSLACSSMGSGKASATALVFPGTRFFLLFLPLHKLPHLFFIFAAFSFSGIFFCSGERGRTSSTFSSLSPGELGTTVLARLLSDSVVEAGVASLGPSFSPPTAFVAGTDTSSS
mmetsp:Transcript_15193/g.33253  ORF Transcript_15193/g.33253 Transcript_15193/m.33253 type:complete len:246 (+) Transcript_15193:106-843(+)